ncbi:MAG: GYD domain-containing protein [Acidobacteria bacterium]|nr:GYD domain-containing protein [Acidobacteriota bacterium]
MAQYLVQVAYTQEAWASLMHSPQDRSQAVGTAIANLGGKMENFWLAFGDFDVVGIIDMPDNVGAASFAMALAAGGACKSVKTTPLLNLQQGVEAMKNAATCGYKPVSKG